MKIALARSIAQMLDINSNLYIRRANDRFYLVTQYKTYDKTDWQNHCFLTKDEADEIVNHGYASYW